MSNSLKESNIKKVALTSLSGTSIEWYDFFLYGAAAGLVFPKLFFGEVDPTTALVLSLLSTLYPAWRASKIEPANILRYE